MNSEHIVSPKVRFSVWSLKWLEVYKKGLVKDVSYWGSYYNPVVKHLNPYFGEMSIDEIKPIDIQHFFKLKGQTYSLESLKKMRACLNAIFCTAIENDLCFKSPITSSLRLKSCVDPIGKHAYTKEQYNTVFRFAMSQPHGLDIMVLMETGISRSELLGLRWDDIDYDNKAINVNQGTVSQRNTNTGEWEVVSDGLKNQYRRRTIPISNELFSLIANKPQRIKIGGNTRKGISPHFVSTEFVFYSPTGKVYSPDNWHKRVYMPFMRDMHNAYSDIPILHAHELRHTRATLWYEDGVQLMSLAYLGGWTDVKMLRKRYAHFSVKKLREELKLNN